MSTENKRTALISPLALAAALLSLAGVASAQHFATPSFNTLGGSQSILHLAQAKQAPQLKLIVDVNVQGRAGEKLKFPARLEPAGAETSQYVMLYQVPVWLKVVGGEAVGNGVWLVPARGLAATELQFEASATGRQEIVVSLLASNGTDVQSEAKLMVNVAASSPPAGAPRTWQSLVGAGANAGAAGAVPSSASAQPAAAQAPDVENEAELRVYARHLVRECTTCHSVFGNDVGIPVMVGLSRDRFIDTMNLYRTGRRDHGPMKAVAEVLDERDTLALALYLGRIQPAVTTAATGTATAAAPTAATAVLAKRTAKEPPERIERWLKRGQDFLATGDIAQARLMFERAAENGSAMAAYHLGTSFDPNVMSRRPGLGVDANPTRAREWYGIAKQLGPVPDADRRLSELR